MKRRDPALAWMIITMSVILILLIWFFCKETFAAEPVDGGAVDVAAVLADTTVADLEQGITWLLDRDNTPATDERRGVVHELAEAFLAAGQATQTDPWLLVAMSYRESSFKLSACGKKNERGLLQVHGQALKHCQKLGLDPSASLAQSALCGASWLSQAQEQCGTMAAKTNRCIKEHSAYDAVCDGALSAYISGSCKSSDIVARRVALRLRDRDKMLLNVKMPIKE